MKAKYRIKQYNRGAWCVEELIVTPEINEKTGKPNKKPGERWTPVKYPGNLEQASRRLLSLVIGDDHETVEELIKAVQEAEQAVVTAVSDYVLLKGKQR